MNGHSDSTIQRLSIYNSYKYMSTAPSYTNHPDVYGSPCDLFIVDHVYLFDYKLVSGIINRGDITGDF